MKKVTKIDRFADIRTLLVNCADMSIDLPCVSTIDELIAFVDNEISLLKKKNTTVSKAAAEKKTENSRLANIAYDVLCGFDTPVEYSMISSNNDELHELSPQKLAAIMRILIDDGRVEKIQASKTKKPTFTIVR